MQKGRDAFSSILIGFALLNSVSHWLASAHCFVNGWPAVTWQFVDPIISVCSCVQACGCMRSCICILYVRNSPLALF